MLQFFTDASLDFQERISQRNGLGNATFFPPSLHEEPPDCNMTTAREEAELVLFGVVQEVLDKTSECSFSTGHSTWLALMHNALRAKHATWLALMHDGMTLLDSQYRPSRLFVLPDNAACISDAALCGRSPILVCQLWQQQSCVRGSTKHQKFGHTRHQKITKSCVIEVDAAGAGLKAKDIDILVVNCSLFNPTPSLSAMIVNHFKMRSDVITYNLAGASSMTNLSHMFSAMQMCPAAGLDHCTTSSGLSLFSICWMT